MGGRSLVLEKKEPNRLPASLAAQAYDKGSTERDRPVKTWPLERVTKKWVPRRLLPGGAMV